MKLKLDSSVALIPKVGPKYQELLRKLNIETVEDLLYYVPFRYDDFSKTKRIADLKEDEMVTISAVIEKVDNIFTRYRKKITKAKVVDGSGSMNITWFNQHYVKQYLQQGKRYYFSGKTKKYSGTLSLLAPTFERVGKENLSTGRLVPIYGETKGITSKWIRTKINDVFENMNDDEELQEFIPKKIIDKYKLIGLREAVNKIHFPSKEKDIKTAENRLAFEELLVEMLKIEDRKNEWNKNYEGVHIEYKRQKKKLDEFIDRLPFKLTNSQTKAIKEIICDLDTKKPMNRLLEGDVGSGKTVVAITAAYLTHLNGFKTLYMAPTEILAKQHYETFNNFLKGFDVEIKLKTGINKKSNITKDTNDIITGTHAILHESEKIHNVGTIIIDEQHRFGVEQRAKIVKMGTKDRVPNLLTMTATPIPRTLALTLYGDLDISVLDEVPNIGKKITTKVVPENYREKTYKWIKSKGEQAFIVCPFITESFVEEFENIKAAEKEYEILKAGVFSDVKMGLLHGRLKAKEKHQVIDDFRKGRTQVLVSTPVVEVGVDIPEAVIMVIESAERYGLASLHQLRGRVGRGEKEGYCFVFLSNYSKRAYARLKNLEKIDSGLKLAEIDMKYRGQGDIFGTMQHGFKQFRVADVNDLEMLEAAKVEAGRLFKEIDKHKLLKKKIEQKTQFIIDN